MRKNYYLSEREGLAAALKQMRHYNVYAHCMIDLSQFEEELLLQCFKADFDSPIHKDFEKLLAAAAVRTVMGKSYIPQKWKEKIAKKAARQQIESYREAVITYKEATGEVSSREAQERRRENQFIDRVGKLDSAARVGIKKAAKEGVVYGLKKLIEFIEDSTITGNTVKVIRMVTTTVIELIPQEIKKAIVEKLKDITDRTVMIVRTFADRLAERCVSVAQKVKDWLVKIPGQPIPNPKPIPTPIPTPVGQRY